MHLFQFEIGSKQVNMTGLRIAEQFMRSPGMLGHRFSDDIQSVLRDPEVLQKVRAAESTVSLGRQKISIALQNIIINVYPNPDAPNRGGWGSSV